MAAGSLNKLSVYVDSTNGNQGLLMPKMKYRFRASFINFGGEIGDNVELTKQIVDIKRPSVNFNPITLDVYNSKVYLLGKPEWQETTINLRDDAGGNISRLVGHQVQKQFDFAEQSSAASGGNYKFQLVYEVLDGGNGANNAPTVLETWELYGCFISQVDYGDLNYSSNDPAQIALTIKFDNAIQGPGGNGAEGIGAQVARNVGTNVTGIGDGINI